MTIHRLKVWTEYWDDLVTGQKPFEIRRDDRTPTYEPGDVLCLEEFTDGVVGGYTGVWAARRIGKLWRGGAIPHGFCAFVVERCESVDASRCAAIRGEITVSK